MDMTAPTSQRFLFVALLAVWAGVATACGVADEPTVAPSATVTGTPGATVTTTPGPTATIVPGTPADTVPAAKYLLLSRFELFYCDPYEYPIGRPDAEREAALEQFAVLHADADEFEAITAHLGMEGVAGFTDDQKVLIFREHNRLNAVVVEDSGPGYTFEMRITEAEEGYALAGTISSAGEVTVETKALSFNTCPICLAAGTLISTPAGEIAVQDIRVGQIVWSQDASGARVPAAVLEVVAKPASPGQQVVRVMLDDGRTITVSPGHPTADGRVLAQFLPGDPLDGARVVAIDWLDYTGPATYDILPSGTTGTYWAGGVLLGSTLFRVEAR